MNSGAMPRIPYFSTDPLPRPPTHTLGHPHTRTHDTNRKRNDFSPKQHLHRGIPSVFTESKI
eukprot:scaffold132156_cov66-Phaeocystis_antarctica.AAC.1